MSHLPAADSDRTDRAQDRINTDWTDDATDSDRTDRAQYRINTDRTNDRGDVGNAHKCDRIPNPTDGAVSKIHRGGCRRGQHRNGNCTRHQGESGDRQAVA